MIGYKRETNITEMEGTYGILKVNINYKKSNYKCEFYKNRFIKSEQELSDIDITVVYKVDKDVLKNIRSVEWYFRNDVISYQYKGYVYECYLTGGSDIVFKDNNIITVVYKCKGHVYYPVQNEYLNFQGAGNREFDNLGTDTKVDMTISANGEIEKLNDFFIRIYDGNNKKPLTTISFKAKDMVNGTVKILSSVNQIIGIDVDKIHIDEFITIYYNKLIFVWDNDLTGYNIYFNYRQRV